MVGSDGDLISRSALKRYIQENGMVYANKLDEFPAVDAVEVVRCKDCKRVNGFPEKVIEPNEVGICRINMMAVKPNGFCSYGERRAERG